ncbi:MAG: DUF6279 family lipoprotein [Bdellovibrionia bacterium]
MKYALIVVEQIKEDNWRAYLKDFKEETQEIAEQKAKSRLKKNIERFFGHLSAEQKKLVQDFEKNHAFDPQIRVQNREATIQKFEAAFQDGFSTAKLREITTQWIQKSSEFGAPQAKVFYEQRRQAIVELLAKLLVLRSPEQTQNIIEELSALEGDLVLPH